MKPMLAATCENVADLRFPLYASPKLDGVRAVVINGKLKARSLKPIPNVYVNEMFGRKDLNGLDGELIWGDPTSKSVYRDTIHATRNEDSTAGKKVKFFVFDDFTGPEKPFETRMKLSRLAQGDSDSLVFVEQLKVDSAAELLALEAEYLEAGYEGLILRSPDGKYKFGRSTMKEQGMVKLKRFTDSEFLLLDVEEEMENTNEAKKNALGRTERSSAQAGLVGKSRAGTLCGRDLKSGVEFRLGTGMNDDDKAWFWKHRAKLKGKFVGKYKSFLIGVKDKPRFPVYLGPREKWDL